MGDRFAPHAIRAADQDTTGGTPALDGAIPGAGPVAGPALDGTTPETDPDWVETMASLDDCDGYVVLMVDPQTAEVDAHGPYGGPDAAVAAEMLTSSLAEEGLGDVVVRIVRLHFPAGGGRR